MPNDNVDFFFFLDIKEVKVNPEGWINPLTIEYDIGLYGDTPAYHWRVKGTTHTFVIPVLQLNYLSSGDYAAHFKKVLEGFRKDFLDWRKEGFYTEWMQEYKKQFSNYIVI